jgi:hypothetical protein
VTSHASAASLRVPGSRKKASRGPSSGAVEPFMADVGYTPAGDEAAARDKARLEADRRAAGRVVARWLLSRGCRGPGCDRGHRKHLQDGRDLLMALEIMPDPQAKPVHWTGNKGTGA